LPPNCVVVVKVVEPPAGASTVAHCWLVLASKPESERPSPLPSFSTTPLCAGRIPPVSGIVDPYGYALAVQSSGVASPPSAPVTASSEFGETGDSSASKRNKREPSAVAPARSEAEPSKPRSPSTCRTSRSVSGVGPAFVSW
jgi:hypothetical protein